MENSSVLNQLRNFIEESNQIVFFGGAGVSTESDIPDFRSQHGLYNQTGFAYPPEKMLHKQFFTDQTDIFFEYYFSHMIYPGAKPNKAHTGLAELERRGKLQAVVTQNIDGLHQMAGSRTVIELHGSIHRNFCVDCGTSYALTSMLEASPGIPRCRLCGGIVKPDVVLYGESLRSDVINEAVSLISRADLLIVGGTSLTVYPAVGLIRYFRGRKLVLINRDATSYDRDASLIIRAPIGQVFSALLNDEDAHS